MPRMGASRSITIRLNGHCGQWRLGERKNFLFAGSDAGGDRAAAIYSLIGSAKLNGLDPEAYLRFVIARIADYRINELDDLLPWRVAEQIANTEHHAAAA